MKKISIIIPVFNAETSIDQCLSSLQDLRYPSHELDIIVVDNGSTDATIEKVKQYPAKLLTLPKANVSRLRNFGALHAQGEVVAFLDADCVAPASWLQKAMELLAHKGTGAVGCWYRLPAQTCFWERVWNAHMGGRALKCGGIDWVPSGNLIMPKNVFHLIGGFDEWLTTAEDVDICRRIRLLGLLVVSHSDLAAVHLGESKNLKQFLLKEKWRGEGVLQSLRREFPDVTWNKALGFAAVTWLALAGMALSIGCHHYVVCRFFFVLFFIIPIYLTVQACARSRQWRYCLPLVFLFAIYGVARVLSAFNPKVWRV